MNDMGLKWDAKRHCFVWGWRHGFGRGWLPYRVSHPFVKVVHFVSCRLWEHHWMFDMDKIPERLPYVGDGHDEAYVTAFWDKYRDEVCTSCGAKRVRPVSNA